jgi:hypothetical protein
MLMTRFSHQYCPPSSSAGNPLTLLTDPDEGGAVLQAPAGFTPQANVAPVVHRNLGDEPLTGTSDGSKGSPGNSKRRLNALTMAGSHGSVEAANSSAASIKAISQSVSGSAVSTLRPIKNTHQRV